MKIPSDIRDRVTLEKIVAYVLSTMLDQEISLDELTTPAYNEFSDELVDGIRAGLADDWPKHEF